MVSKTSPVQGGMRLGINTLATFLVLAVCVPICTRATEQASRFSERDFYLKNRMFPPHVVLVSQDVARATSVIGGVRYYRARKGDTFLDLARFYGLGYNEIAEANPGVDPWVPAENQTIVLPTEWVLPQSDHVGIVVNIPEMRLYYFYPSDGSGQQLVSTYPVGLGRDDWRTPRGKFKIKGKTLNPTWVIPESIRQERIKEKGFSEEFIPGGHPDNPLGKHRLELTMPDYRIHGTNIPWGVGMQVSHGCVRLYPEDIEQLFSMARIGDPGEFIYQPVKIGARRGRVFAEVHADIYRLTPGLFREARRILEQLGWSDYVDTHRLEEAVAEQTGVPVDVTGGREPSEELLEEILHPAMRAPQREAVSQRSG